MVVKLLLKVLGPHTFVFFKEVLDQSPSTFVFFQKVLGPSPSIFKKYLLETHVFFKDFVGTEVMQQQNSLTQPFSWLVMICSLLFTTKKNFLK